MTTGTRPVGAPRAVDGLVARSLDRAWSATLAIYDARWVLLPPLTGVAMLAMLVGAVIVAPREAIEGEVQRIFYIHVPSALAAYLAFFVVFAASIALLWTRDLRFDAVARAAAGVGVLFTALTLATGAIWGKPIWGTWWAWDARLTSTLVLLLIYVGYLLARSLSDRGDVQAARYAAVLRDHRLRRHPDHQHVGALVADAASRPDRHARARRAVAARLDAPGADARRGGDRAARALADGAACRGRADRRARR